MTMRIVDHQLPSDTTKSHSTKTPSPQQLQTHPPSSTPGSPAPNASTPIAFTVSLSASMLSGVLNTPGTSTLRRPSMSHLPNPPFPYNPWISRNFPRINYLVVAMTADLRWLGEIQYGLRELRNSGLKDLTSAEEYYDEQMG
ncbi:hypothetical protein Ccrd_014480 [Cynara cardunculus var. scolymus]|uniref:Uncharacterized protein n=1 Tax=Cynara cardunculus var. scolymus TaxID=59895 RepID=A0A118K491_CYNCS|nr:hypothetical protein Ccrd_014480 [Cynara cardunculus var. scolymus]